MSIGTDPSLPSKAEDGLGDRELIPHLVDRITACRLNRLRVLEGMSADARILLDELIVLATRGLPRMHSQGMFAHTLRSVRTAEGTSEQLEGESLRYTAIASLGLSCLADAVQCRILAGSTAADLAQSCAKRAETTDDPGAVALAAWAAAEAGKFFASKLFRRLSALLATASPVTTVDCAWALTAAIGGQLFEDTSDLRTLAANRLLAGQAASGLFPHMLPSSASGRLRAHIGCFADQVYPIQALSRLHAASGNPFAIRAAEAAAGRICALQGPAGQWWWHYDTRNGGVVEGYPVYSVHQHAIAPMALLDLREAGGSDHWQAIIRGLEWLNQPPETPAPLVSPEKNVVWRKVARREPNKAARALAAMATALTSGARLRWLDIVFPPNRVDRECRPYEFGWLLYTWLAGGPVARLTPGRVDNQSSASGGGAA